ncbi:MAG: secondary thiamine-phosphate synthase enzyme YjbQ [Candidatus Aminicenantes bacterium]|nr:secondary thiamine-phosphate synthase enzyme YjbQ [Candidatus Aminicenantes bacterium]
MKVISDSLSLSTSGFSDMKDLTGDVSKKLSESGLRDGIVNLFVPGSTGGLTTIEYESGLVEDFSEFMEKMIPSNKTYHHDARWGDGNGFSHVRASLLGPSLNVPFSGGTLNLGTWQQIVFLDFDNRSRSRTILLQFMGE